ncbi:MAG: winged helix-turn-helix domain-containing protein, partial [Povalibacter sp.]
MRNAAETRIFEFGGFHLDAATRQLSGPDGAVEVPARAFDVLLYMVAHRGELLDKTRLLKAVWPTTAVEEGNLSQCIFALRRAFGDTATEPRFIATVSGRGYQFIAQVRESSAVIAPPGRARPRFTGRFYVGIGLVTVALFAVFRFWPASTESEPSTVSSPFVPASLAVLPFTDLSSTKDMEYFADGIAQELMSSLSKVRGLHIVSGHSSFAFKGKTDDARSIGERLHAETILEGSIRKESDRIRITVQLTRTNDGLSLWAETYDRQFDDVLDIQGSIASEVAKALAPVLQRDSNSGQIQSSESTLTHDAQAYRAYLRGVYLLTRWIDRDPQSARVEFLGAVERDPLFARAYAMLARTYEVSANLKIGDVAQNKSLASSALNKALQLDPSIGDLWWVRLMFVAGDDAPIAIRARDLERTIAANPTEIEPMVWLAHIYIVLARRDDALQMFERAYTT